MIFLFFISPLYFFFLFFFFIYWSSTSLTIITASYQQSAQCSNKSPKVQFQVQVDSKFNLKVFISLREGINWKKTFSFGHCPNYLNPPPMTLIRATWSSFFGSQNSRFESQFRTKITIYSIHYIIYCIYAT